MKTLKEELQEIVDKNKLTDEEYFICWHLSESNIREFRSYKEMASNYAKEHYMGGGAFWRYTYSTVITDYVISEKYRFIKDLIAIL
jgi:hypothetical protein